MEMILSLLILSLTAAACVQVFAAARTCRREAREWNHIQELTTSAGEILEGSDGSREAFLELLPGGSISEGGLLYTFDSQWQPCGAGDAVYRFSITLSVTDKEKQAVLNFRNAQGDILYEQSIRFPVLGSEASLTTDSGGDTIMALRPDRGNPREDTIMALRPNKGNPQKDTIMALRPNRGKGDCL